MLMCPVTWSPPWSRCWPRGTGSSAQPGSSPCRAGPGPGSSPAWASGSRRSGGCRCWVPSPTRARAPAGQGQFNSPQRLQAVWRELQLLGPLAEAVASLGGPVLVIDDRVNSGCRTMTVAARLLRESGAARVLPLVLAVTAG